MVYRIILNALRQIRQQPFRTLLVLQGVIWGTALGVFPPALIHGSFKKAEEDAARSGIDRILMTLEKRNKSDSYTWENIHWLRTNYIGQFKALSAYGFGRKNRNRPATILATDTNALAARAMHMRAGRFFTAEEINRAERVCVVDLNVTHDVLAFDDPVGKSITIDREEFKIIGVTDGGTASDLDEFGYQDGHVMSDFIRGLQRNLGAIRSGPAEELNEATCIMVPYTTKPGLQPVLIEMRAEPKVVLDLRDQLRSDLISFGRQPVIYTNAILPFLYRQTLDTFKELNRAVFFLCVMTGTCVVCILMVLSVVERSREIAIRRVEGARRWHVGLQFVIETGTICTVGGILGVPTGMALAAIRVWIEPLGAVTWAFPPVESVVMVSVVTVIGLIGGLLPAWRAMKLDPVEVLRHE